MLTRLGAKIKPKKGFSYFFHLALNILLPILLVVLVRQGFFNQALILILLSKWRMFSLRPRHWAANIRANSVDLIIGISLLVFIAESNAGSWQVLWAVLY